MIKVGGKKMETFVEQVIEKSGHQLSPTFL